jgi:hypothetical protein
VGYEQGPAPDLSLKQGKVALYEVILRAVYGLYNAGIFAVEGPLLAEQTGLDEETVGKAALELRQNNFFDSRSRANALTLTPEQVAFGVEGACRALRQVCALSAEG